MLLWFCVCIFLPTQAQGALVVSRGDDPTQVFEIGCMCIICPLACAQMAVLLLSLAISRWSFKDACFVGLVAATVFPQEYK